MRILVDPGSHHLLNVGDVAMLEVCWARLLELWPDARIEVLTEAPDLLERSCPGAVPVPAAGRHVWLRQPNASDPAGPAHRAATRAWRAGAPGAGALFRTLLRARRRRSSGTEVATFLDALLQADLVVIAGRGSLTDAFRDESFALLAEVEAAGALGKPVAMLGQGIGPLADRALTRRAAQVLPRAAAFIAVREGTYGPALLAGLGVDEAHVEVTGDDAIGLMPQHESRSAERRTIGVSLRAVDYAELPEAAGLRLAKRLAAACARLDAEPLPLAMSRHPYDADEQALAALSDGRVEVPQRPEEAIRLIGSCRVVVTGTYHAAVFALAQGIPAVCLYRSPYYRDKLLGLRERFGRWCVPVELDGRGAGALEEPLTAAWEGAGAAQAELLGAARLQRAAGERAYARLRELAPGGITPACPTDPSKAGRDRPSRALR